MGELKDKYETLVENVKKSLQEIILNSLDALSSPKIDEDKVLRQVEKIRTLLETLPPSPRE